MPGLLDTLSQMWPARLAQAAWSGITAPGDAYAGRLPLFSPDGHVSDEAIGRAANLAGLVTGMPGRPSGSVGVGIAGRSASALPMDEASRMARATQQGYTIDAYKGAQPYHWDSLPEYYGSGRVVSGTETRVPKEVTEGTGGTFFSSDPDVASRFATLLQTQGSVLPAKLKMSNPLVIDAKGKPAAAFQFESIAREHGTQAELGSFKTAFDNGYDGIILKNTKDEGTIYVPKEGDQIRSRFAKFDPQNVGSASLLGSMAIAPYFGPGDNK